MIGKLTGILSGPPQDRTVLVDVQGVGYCVRVPLGFTLADGSPIALYIHTAVREDAIDLYGFLHEEDLGFFRQLMSVSGVGPKTALSIMSVGEPAALKRSIAAGGAAALCAGWVLRKARSKTALARRSGGWAPALRYEKRYPLALACLAFERLSLGARLRGRDCLPLPLPQAGRDCRHRHQRQVIRGRACCRAFARKRQASCFRKHHPLLCRRAVRAQPF